MLISPGNEKYFGTRILNIDFKADEENISEEVFIFGLGFTESVFIFAAAEEDDFVIPVALDDPLHITAVIRLILAVIDFIQRSDALRRGTVKIEEG